MGIPELVVLILIDLTFGIRVFGMRTGRRVPGGWQWPC